MPTFTSGDPGYKHNVEYFANLIKKFIPARNLTELTYATTGPEAEYWRQVNLGNIPDALGSFRATAPTAAANVAQTAAPAPVVSAGSKDYSGQITFGSGTGPVVGAQANVTFGGGAYAAAPFVQITPSNAATAALQPYVTAVTTTGFQIAFGVAAAVSQANTTYAVHYRVG